MSKPKSKPANRPVAAPPGAPVRGERPCDDASCCGQRGSTRREFLQRAGAGAASLPLLASPPLVMAGPFRPEDVADHFVPADKKLSESWLKSLFARGEPTVYRGADLKTIAMPIGGLCAGQLYLAGDGRLMHWDVFNEHLFTGYGRTNYEEGRAPKPVLQQGFALQVRSGGETSVRTLDADGFPDVEFCGEYPIGVVRYRSADCPVSVRLEAFSPFIPLNAPDSALPATVMRLRLKNESASPVSAELAGWLENGVCRNSSQELDGFRMNRVIRGKDVVLVLGSARPAPPPKERRKPIVLADFEGDDYGDWRVEGEAFGKEPAHGTLGRQQPVSGFQGEGLANTFLGGDRSKGKLTSPPFTIERRFINFLIGGGKHEGRTCMNLLVDGRAARTAVGANNEKLTWRHWNVQELAGKEARIEIVDQSSEAWGHVNVDQIELDDRPRAGLQGELKDQADFGTMALALLDGREEVAANAASPEGKRDALFAAGTGTERAERPFGQPLIASLTRPLPLAPGQEATATFVVAWCFPNRPEHGNFYARRFEDAEAVVRYIAKDYERLAGQTRLWRDTWYNSSLPHWLLDRLFSTVTTLAASTCQWWANGRFWAWEGVGCCRGTCTHVWNYEHAMARLFPQLERSVREMQDFDPEVGFVEETGMVRFRGENYDRWAADGQAGTVLKAYREHLVSADGRFLTRNWPRIRKTLEFLIRQDGDGDGLLEGAQHNTYDIEFYGPNTMVGSLYLAALRAAEEMAGEVGDAEFAKKCRRIFEQGVRRTVQRLFNGEYFTQDVNLAEHPKYQYANGCLSDQLFGQGWARQVGLGDVYPNPIVKTALRSIWKYNWAPDTGPQNEAHRPERWFVQPGEAGLFTCTWPKGGYLDQGVRYRNEVWTGIEYQVAGHMAWEGMVTEALAICRGVHDRYHPSKHNPWNEVECGDHYARGMASYGVFLGLCGFEHHGPQGRIGFAPRISPDDFRAAFTAAEGWGAISQRREPGGQTNTIEVKWGRLKVKTLALELPEGARATSIRVAVGDRRIPADMEQEGVRLRIHFAAPVAVEEGQTLRVEAAC